jgi:carnitine O-acetyltransferase
MVRLDVLGPDGTPHTTTEIAAALRGLDGSAGGASVGPLTTKARAAWASSRAALRAADPANPAALDVVETALFCVALEPSTPPDDAAKCAQLLHGDSRRRWFDKAVSFIVFPDGSAGINVEHCRLDGTTVLSLVDGMLSEDTDAHERTVGAHAQGPPGAAPITFVLTPELREDIDAAATDFADFAASVATRLVVFDDVGSTRAKALGTSPDAFVQMSYQLAHRRAKGYTGPTYESIATLRFHHGRTEAMRVVTPQVLAFVAAMDDPDASTDDRVAAFRAAADAHVARAMACQQGSAPEQHLWELSLIQQRHGAELGVMEPPAIVRSPGWTIMRDDAMSTSSAPSVHVHGFGFGSTSDHCIGVAYVLLPDRLILHLSTPSTVAHEMTRFADELRCAFDELGALLG